MATLADSLPPVAACASSTGRSCRRCRAWERTLQRMARSRSGRDPARSVVLGHMAPQELCAKGRGDLVRSAETTVRTLVLNQDFG